jgi:hypothetical protein
MLPTLLMHCIVTDENTQKHKLCGFRSASELYRPSGSRLSAKLVPILAGRVVSATVITAVNLGFLDRRVAEEAR